MKNGATNQSNIKIEDSHKNLTKEMVARKNREQYASRVNHVDSRMRGARDLNLSKESDDLADGAYAKAAMEMGNSLMLIKLSYSGPLSTRTMLMPISSVTPDGRREISSLPSRPRLLSDDRSLYRKILWARAFTHLLLTKFMPILM